MSQTSTKAITLSRTSLDHYVATSVATGASIEFGSDPDLLTPPELLLAAIAGCTAIDIDRPASRHAEPDAFRCDVVAPVTVDPDGAHHLAEITCTWQLRYPDGPEGDLVRTLMPRLFAQAETKLCTVSITVSKGASVRHAVAT